MDPDVKVRVIAAEILLILAQGCSRDEFFDLINIIEKVSLSGILSLVMLVPQADCATSIQMSAC